jgi:hypothetical protein
MVQQMMGNMDKKKFQKLPFNTQMAISKFMGQPLAGNMTQPSILSNQLSFNPNSASNRNSGVKPARLGGVKEMKLASNAQTQTDKISSTERS